MKGFFKRLLIIEMNNQTSRAEPLDEELFRQYLGGKGLATHLLFKHNPPGVDPFDPENHLIMALGPAIYAAS